MYRTRPQSDAPSTSRFGDRALLLAILAVGALPLIGAMFHYQVAGWELGIGTAVVLCAGAELVRDLVGRRPPAAEQPPT